MARRVLLPPTLSAARPPAGAAVRRFGGESMGTTWSALVVLTDAGAPLQQGLQRALDQVVAEMSHWRADSDLGRFNRAPAGTWHCLPPAFFQVLSFALEVAQASGGAYDPCAGGLVNRWGFGPVGRHDQAGFAPPTADEVAALCAARAGRALERDAPRRRVFQPGGLQLDLSAVAKGYSVDCLARYLDGQGLAHYLVEVGGELRGAGVKPDGQPWWVALEAPAGANLPAQTVLALHGLAVATSGDYRRYFLYDGRRRAHTIDPRSGQPVANGVAAVSVVHEQAMAADAWSTALTVLGPVHGLALAERKGLAARFLLRDGAGLREVLSSAFQQMLEDAGC